MSRGLTDWSQGLRLRVRPGPEPQRWSFVHNQCYNTQFSVSKTPEDLGILKVIRLRSRTKTPNEISILDNPKNVHTSSNNSGKRKRSNADKRDENEDFPKGVKTREQLGFTQVHFDVQYEVVNLSYHSKAYADDSALEYIKIFKHLHPLDLLTLARTTKLLRNILMRHSSAIIWKTARSLIKDLPECPNELSEPSYAAFMFDTSCYVHYGFW